MGPFVLSSVGPFIRFICSEAVGGTAGKSGAGCGMCPRMAFHHLLRQLLVMGPPGPTLLAFARYFPLAVCHAGLFGPAQMTASAWARRSEVWGLLPLQLGHPPYREGREPASCLSCLAMRSRSPITFSMLF